jgi:predicted O-linked N-acetylglucosamine transferase (SPINDLY family)
LPEKSFVFCNFNASYKLTPEAFAGWVRILRQVPDSVLWLLEFHSRFSENLRRQAKAQGIPGSRILFAPVVGHEAHMARLARADLFLDALPYNAHTTASDALWAGVPLVTCKGKAFAGRVAASVLNAVGLPELVRENQDDYEALAVALARDPARLDSIRRKLAENRLTTPLFDTARFTRNLEAAYTTMWETRGEAPRGFGV